MAISAASAQVLAQSSDKYTSKDTVVIYKFLMEADGIKWDPSLKNGGSWGTGFMYLDKGQPEWAAQSNIEAGVFLGKKYYYFEVTGSDDECVYITQWSD